MDFPPLKFPLKFYAVIPTVDWIERMVKAGADTVQLHCKTLYGDKLKREVERCVAACQSSATQFFINGRQREVIGTGAYDAYFGQEDMDTAGFAATEAAGLRLGLSACPVAELDRALSVRPSCVAGSAILPIAAKQIPTAPQGLDKLREYARQAHSMPVATIGGIDLNSTEDVPATGISSLAVAHAVTEAENPEAVVKASQALRDQ